MIVNKRQVPKNPNGICIVGEAFGKEEDTQDRPFVGWSGKYLTSLLRQAGIIRQDCFITNVVNKRPPGNKFYMFSEEEIEAGVKELQGDLETWRDDIKIIIALGNNALKYLTGEDGIFKFRGTVINCSLVDGLKVLPTLHPAALIRGLTACSPVVTADLRKAKVEAKYQEIREDEKDIRVIRDPSDAVAIMDSLCDIDKPVVCDIETPYNKGIKWLTAYGVATSPQQAYVLTEEVCEVPKVLQAIGRFSRSGTKKIYHNAGFDVFNLAYSYGIVNHNVGDTMIMQHDCYPFLPSILKPKSLAFCSSMYAHEPYWKGEAKTDRYIYNGKDNCITYKVYNALQKEMRDWDVQEVYKHDMALFEPLLTMELKGVRINFDTLKRIKERNEEIIRRLEYIKDQVIGKVNIKSHKQMIELLYDKWKLPVIMDKGKKTTDKKALHKLEKLSTPYQPIFGLIQTLKKHYTLRGFYNLSLSKDGRMRTGYKIAGTITGRLASAELAGIGVGRNLQNIPKQMREIYVPDEGKIFINIDLSQAEARVVAALTGDKAWLDEFSNEDTYKKVGAYLFNKPKEEVTKDERQVAKKVTHACNYGESFMGLKEVLDCDAKRAKYLIGKVYELRPLLEKWHKDIENTVKKERLLRSDYGRILAFYGKITNKDIRTALSFVPQGTVADYLNRGIVRIYEEMGDEIELMIQVHDSIMVQVPTDKDTVKRVIKRMKELVEQPVTVNGLTFVIPSDAEIGMDWLNLYEVDDTNFEEVWDEKITNQT